KNGMVIGVVKVLNCEYFFFQAEDGIRSGHVTGVQTCALPILGATRIAKPAPPGSRARKARRVDLTMRVNIRNQRGVEDTVQTREDRKSTRLNSSHVAISYAVFCLKKKNTSEDDTRYSTIAVRV